MISHELMGGKLHVYPQPSDPVFPGNHVKLFNGVLARANLKLDRDSKRRTAYSLRHTYICMRLMEGADIYQIAKNCRPSVEMIEKFYAAHIKTTLNAAVINVMRSKAPRSSPRDTLSKTRVRRPSTDSLEPTITELAEFAEVTKELRP